jgi:hypothetical protein
MFANNPLGYLFGLLFIVVLLDLAFIAVILHIGNNLFTFGKILLVGGGLFWFSF